MKEHAKHHKYDQYHQDNPDPVGHAQSADMDLSAKVILKRIRPDILAVTARRLILGIYGILIIRICRPLFLLIYLQDRPRDQARIAKLRRELDREQDQQSIRVTLEGESLEYAE